jgi:hypothetical protein
MYPTQTTHRFEGIFKRCVDIYAFININYEENVMTSFKLNLLLMIFWLHIINYNS